jgi:hypothetical protein
MKAVFKNILVSLSGLLLILSFSGVSNITVSAQGTGPNVGFAECNFTGDGKNGAELIQSCLRSVFTFSFVVALFLIAFRVGFNAIEDYNPFSNGNATNDAISTVWEVTIGLILIGGPVLFLNTVNSTLLNFDFLNLGNLTSQSSTPGTQNTVNPNPAQFNTSASQAGLNGNPTLTIGSGNIGLDILKSSACGLKFFNPADYAKCQADVLTNK